MLVRSVCEGKARALCRKDDGRVKEFPEKDGHPAETMRPSHAHPLRKLCSGRRRFITDWGFARRLARIRGDRSLGRAALCALGTADEIYWTVTGQRSVSFDWRGSATGIRSGLPSACGGSATG